MMYLTQPDYVSLGGRLDEATFNSIIYDIQYHIDWITFNRLKNETVIPEEVKRCIFSIIDIFIKQKNLLASTEDSNKEITSMSNDGVSVSYNTLSSNDIITKSQSYINQIIFKYLNSVKNSEGKLLTFRGLYPGE